MEPIYQEGLLKSLDQQAIRDYLENGDFRIQHYGKDAVIHFQDDPCTSLEIILSGEVVIERLDADGNILTVAQFVAHDILGGTLVFSTHPAYPLTVTARQPSKLLVMEKAVLLQILQSQPAMLQCYLNYVADRTSLLGNRLRTHVKRSIREQILSYMRQECRRQNTCRIQLRFSKTAWANQMGVQRTSLSRELAKMRDEGLIEYDAKTITLLLRE